VLYGFLAVVIAFTGPGRYSLDHALGITALSSLGWSVAAVVVGVVAAIPMLLRRRAALRPQ
jgi:putative oxidoreductase